MKSSMTTANGLTTITRTFEDADTATRYAMAMTVLPGTKVVVQGKVVVTECKAAYPGAVVDERGMAKTTAEPPTHYVHHDEPGKKPWSIVSAACGATVRRNEHANEPTCEDCQRILKERDEVTF